MMAHEALPPPMLLLKKPSISDPECMDLAFCFNT